jgi:hypothetical protein
MVNTARFVILVFAYRFLVPFLSAERDHAKEVESTLIAAGLPWL